MYIKKVMHFVVLSVTSILIQFSEKLNIKPFNTNPPLYYSDSWNTQSEVLHV